METSILVSVIVPAYNAAATIGETLLSIRRQTHRNLEIIVVDDGSTDATRAVAQAHAAQDGRIKLVSQRNAGVAAARNAGLAAATGLLVAPVDADDLWRPEKIALQVAMLAERGPRTSLVYAWYALIDDESRVRGVARPREEGNVLPVLCTRNIVGHGSSPLMWRKDVLSVGGYDTALRAQGAQGCEDWKLYLALARLGAFAVVPAVLIGYRQGQASMSSDIAQMLRSHNTIVADLKRTHADLAVPVRKGQVEIAHYYLKRAIRAGEYRSAMQAVRQTGAADPWLLARMAASLARDAAGMAVRRFRPPATARPDPVHMADFLGVPDFPEDTAPPPAVAARQEADISAMQTTS